MVPFLQSCKRYLELAHANTAYPFPRNHREPWPTKPNLPRSARSQPGKSDGTTPPDALSDPPRRSNGKPVSVIKDASRGSRQAATTVVRLVTGRVFVGSYTARFHPHKGTSCPTCRVNPQTVKHVNKFYPGRLSLPDSPRSIPVSPLRRHQKGRHTLWK